MDIPEAYYAARWQADKIYLAVKVRDTSHYFTDSYSSATARDAIEIYLHTDNNGNVAYQTNQAVAQQYVVGMKPSCDAVWLTTVGSNGCYDLSGTPEVATAAGRIDGEWIYYEIAITPYTYFGLLESNNLNTSVISTLFTGEVIGLDVCVVGNSAGTYTGMKSENTDTGKWCNWEQFGLHELTAGTAASLATTVIESRNGRIETTCNAAGMDYVQNNGRVHIDATKYKHITLSGTVTNWTGFVDTSWNWAAGFISLIGTDYFANPMNVPTVTDETMTSVFSYLGDTNYGTIDKQMGWGANAGLCLWKDRIDRGYTSGFAVQDCVPNDPPAGHDVEMGRSLLSDPTQFEYELVYDLANGVLTARYRDIGDSEWDYAGVTKIGLRNDYTSLAGTPAANDNWSNVIFTVQMENGLTSANPDTYGFNYTIKMKVAGVVSGDANLDGSVDVGDLGILAANYGGTGKSWNQGDFNNDGLVDVGDLGILAAHYGTSASKADWSADYAKAFGSTVTDDINEDTLGSSICNGLGLSLIAGLALMGLMLVKLEE
jgi:hypothetical protein